MQAECDPPESRLERRLRLAETFKRDDDDTAIVMRTMVQWIGKQAAGMMRAMRDCVQAIGFDMSLFDDVVEQLECSELNIPLFVVAMNAATVEMHRVVCKSAEAVDNNVVYIHHDVDRKYSRLMLFLSNTFVYPLVDKYSSKFHDEHVSMLLSDIEITIAMFRTRLDESTLNKLAEIIKELVELARTSTDSAHVQTEATRMRSAFYELFESSSSYDSRT